MLHKRISRLLVVAIILLVTVPGISALALQTDDAPQIRLQYASFDPLDGEPILPASAQLEAAAGEPAMSLVQFRGPVQQEWKDAVEAAGARLYDYIPDYAFISRMDAATAQAVRQLPFVRWVGPYQPAYRLPASLNASSEAAEAPLELDVQVLPDADLSALSGSRARAFG